jgi:hypothetical protein
MREEGDVEEDHRQPEVHLAQRSLYMCRSTSAASSRGRRRQRKAPSHHHVVEVGHHVIGVLQLDVDRVHRQHQAGEAADGEQRRKPRANSIGVSKVIEPRHMVATQLKTFTPVGTAISIVAYMKYSWPVTGMPVVHVVRPDDERQDQAIDGVA